MRKRLILYVLVLILGIVLSNTYDSKDIGFLAVLYSPFSLVVNILSSLSEESGFGNVLAWGLLIIISLLPLLLGYVTLRKNTSLFDLIGLSILSIVLGITFYISINLGAEGIFRSVIIFFRDLEDAKLILSIGLYNVWLSLCLLYLLARQILFVKSLLKSLKYILPFFVSYAILLATYVLSMSKISFNSYQTTLSSYDSLFGFVESLLAVVLIEFILMFVEYILDGSFKEKLITLTKLIKGASIGLLSVSLIKVCFVNLFQLAYITKLSNTNFTFKIDIFYWVLVFFFYGLYEYIVLANQAVLDQELTI
ncbi:hypothetical protein JN09_001022 [Acholeplasma morum]|uniref:hypothetical protein n=1 Tax=Paracholeplasma morum TaxID=264637 RepID=UPI00195CCD63|nr:hypothetical protein [Paracholeplasma morum]MBM7453690.1 hypothetical protein [Paracholeplasma morum]